MTQRFGDKRGIFAQRSRWPPRLRLCRACRSFTSPRTVQRCRSPSLKRAPSQAALSASASGRCGWSRVATKRADCPTFARADGGATSRVSDPVERGDERFLVRILVLAAGPLYCALAIHFFILIDKFWLLSRWHLHELNNNTYCTPVCAAVGAQRSLCM